MAVFGSKPTNDLFKKENPVGKVITINDIQYKVIGVLESKGGGGLGANIDNHVIIPFLIEAVTLSLVGGSIGILLGFLGSIIY